MRSMSMTKRATSARNGVGSASVNLLRGWRRKASSPLAVVLQGVAGLLLAGAPGLAQTSPTTIVNINFDDQDPAHGNYYYFGGAFTYTDTGNGGSAPFTAGIGGTGVGGTQGVALVADNTNYVNYWGGGFGFGAGTVANVTSNTDLDQFVVTMDVNLLGRTAPANETDSFTFGFEWLIGKNDGTGDLFKVNKDVTFTPTQAGFNTVTFDLSGGTVGTGSVQDLAANAGLQGNNNIFVTFFGGNAFVAPFGSPGPGKGIVVDNLKISQLAPGSSNLNQWKGPGGNYSDATNWTGGIVPNSGTAVAVFGQNATGSTTVNLDIGFHLLARLFFDNANPYTLSGAPGYAIRLAGNYPTLPPGAEVVQGNHKVDATVISFSNASFTIAAGSSLEIKQYIAQPFPLFGVNRFYPPIESFSGGGTLKVTEFIRGGALANAKDGGGSYTSFYDLQRGFAALYNGFAGESEADLRAQISQWWNGGARDGKGLGTSAFTATGPDSFLTVGYISNDAGGGNSYYLSYRGLTTVPYDGENSSGNFAIDANDWIVGVTYIGDLDLDGVVDGLDYKRAAEGQAFGLTGWFNGDVNYDGVVNNLDLDLIQRSLEAGLPSLGFTLSPGAEVRGIPEPASMGGVMAACAMCVRRRRR